MRAAADVGDDRERQRQVSVAELLAQYGQPAAGGGRRRRAAPENTPPEPEPEPQAVAALEPEAAPHTEAAPKAEAVPTDEAAPRARGVGVLLVELLAAAAVGAALWLGFRWLWGEWPVVALVLALVVSVGSVVAVRLAHRVGDLLSMALALAVGLVVTMSPVALTLVGA